MGELVSSRISRRTFLGGAAAFGVVSLVTPTFAFAAPTAAELRAQADAVRVQVNAVKGELDEKTNIYGAALDEHDRAKAAMEAAQARINECNEKIAGLQGKLGTRARSMYRSGNTSFLDILLGATSFEEFSTNWDILEKMNQDDADMVNESKTLREDLEASKVEYEKEEKIAAQKLAEAKAEKEALEATAAQYQGILNGLDEETRLLLLSEQEAAAVAYAAANPGGGNTSGASGGNGGSAADYGPPAGDILSEAVKYVGCRYTPAGNSPEEGFDCSGFVCYVCRRTGHGVPPRSTYGYGGGWFPVSQAQPGDILWQPNHVGICASPGGGSYVHAANEQYGVCYGSSPQFTRAYRY